MNWWGEYLIHYDAYPTPCNTTWWWSHLDNWWLDKQCSWVDHAELQHWRTISSEEIEQQRLNKMIDDQQRWWAADDQHTWWLALMNKLASRLMRLTNSIGQRLINSRSDWRDRWCWRDTVTVSFNCNCKLVLLLRLGYLKPFLAGSKKTRQGPGCRVGALYINRCWFCLTVVAEPN